MTSKTYFAFVLLGAGSLVACETPLDGDTCPLDARYHQIGLTRELSTTSAPAELDVEACLGDRCLTAKPADDGSFDFGSYDPGPNHGTLTTTDNGAVRVRVQFTVFEASTSELRVRVSSAQGPLDDASARVQWENESCHPSPLATEL